MWRIGSALLLVTLLVQDSGDAAADKARLHDDLAAAAEITGDQLLKLKAWDEARAFLELIRAKSDARAEALDKLIAKTDKQTSGLKWDAKSSELIKTFGAERAKPFLAFARTWKERDPEAARWTEAEGQILADFLDYVKAYARLTQIRAHYELPKTRFDWKLSVPAVWHGQYKLLNPTHSIESEGSTGFTHEGQTTSRRSITSIDESVSDLIEALIHTPYHQNYIFNPRLLSVGLGQANGASICGVVDVKGGLAPDIKSDLTLCIPKNNSASVALSGYDDHIRVIADRSMKEMGYPLSLIFYDPAAELKQVTVTLTESMKAVEVLVSTPENPLVKATTPNIKNSIIIVPKDRLKSGAEYRVSIGLRVNGVQRKIEWAFKTGR